MLPRPFSWPSLRDGGSRERAKVRPARTLRSNACVVSSIQTSRFSAPIPFRHSRQTLNVPVPVCADRGVAHSPSPFWPE
jgi:hypothetical protein